MGLNLVPNTVVCPHCDKEFIHNRVNGVALIEVAQGIESRKRMHCRLTLDAIEREYPNRQIPPAVKKAVLDGYNDLSRDVLHNLGFGTEVE
jgi:hypothetical protein